MQERSICEVDLNIVYGGTDQSEIDFFPDVYPSSTQMDEEF